MTNNLISNDDSRKVFVGRVPHHLDNDTLRAEINKWDNVTSIYYKGPKSGWATAEFKTRRFRDNFLADKFKHKICNEIVDVKAYSSKVKKDKQAQAQAQGRHASPSPVKTVSSTVQPPIYVKPTSPKETGVIVSYPGKHFGVIRSNERGNGFFHFGVVFVCTEHKQMCSDSACAFYARFTPQKNGVTPLQKLLPVSTSVNFVCRNIQHDEYAYQVSVLWPALSRRPHNLQVAETPTLDQQLTQLQPSEPAAVPAAPAAQAAALPEPAESTAYRFPPTRPAPSASAVAAATMPPPFANVRGAGVAAAVPKTVEVNSHLKRLQNMDNDQLLEFDRRLMKMERLIEYFKKRLNRDDISYNKLARELLDEPNQLKQMVKVKDFLKKHDLPDANLGDIVKELQVQLDMCNELEGGMFEPKAHGMGNFVSSMVQRTSSHPMLDDSVVAAASAINKAMTPPFPPPGIAVGGINGVTSVESAAAATAASTAEEDRQVRSKSSTPARGVGASTSTSVSVTGSLSMAGDTTSSASVDYSLGSEELDDDDDDDDDAGGDIANDQFVHMKTKSVNSFKAQSVDEKMLPHVSDTDRKNYLHLSTWVEEHYARNPMVFPTKPRVVASCILLSWRAADKQASNLKDELRKYFGSPAKLMAKWLENVAPFWHKRLDMPPVYLDLLVKTTFTYCYHSLPFHQRSQQNNEVVKLFQSTPFSCEEGLYNQRGVVIHYFNDFVGVIQTAHGKVLFDRHLVYQANKKPSTPASSDEVVWAKVKSAKNIPVGCFVKLHAVQAKKKTKRNKLKYWYANKVWLPWGMEEPQPSVEVQGGSTYWNEITAYFDSVIKANKFMALAETSRGYHREQYHKYFDKYLHEHISKSHAKYVNMDSEKKERILKTYEPFKTYVHLSFPDVKIQQIENAVLLLVARGITLFHLRKDYIAKELFEATDLFEEGLELVLRGVGQSSQPQVREQSEIVCNIAQHLFTFFKEHDQLTKVQLEEQRKTLDNGPKASLSTIESMLNAVFQLQNPLRDVLREGPTPDHMMAVAAELKQVEKANAEADAATATDAAASTATNATAAAAAEASNDSSAQLGEQGGTTATPEGLENGALASISETVEAEEEAEAEDTAAANEIGKALEQINTRLELLELMNKERVEEENKYRNNMNAIITNLLNQVEETKSKLERQRLDFEEARTNHNNVNNNNGRQLVKIAAEGSQEAYEFSVNEDGHLSFDSVKAIFPGVNALKYTSSETGAIRICNQVGDIFQAPQDGWADRVYVANIPVLAAPAGQQANLTNVTTAPGVSTTASAAHAAHLWAHPGVVGPAAAVAAQQQAAAQAALRSPFGFLQQPQQQQQQQQQQNVFLQSLQNMQH